MGIDYSAVDWKELVYYDETSPSGLRWSIGRAGNGRKHGIVGCMKYQGGKRINEDGTKVPRAWDMTYKNKSYLVHRVILLIHDVEIPADMMVDHIDGNPFNNKVSNLRVVTRRQNNQNTRLRNNNVSGHVGVRFRPSSGKQKSQFTAFWTNPDGSSGSKCFYTEELGVDEAYFAAVQYRLDKIKQLNSLGQDYTNRNASWENSDA